MKKYRWNLVLLYYKKLVSILLNYPEATRQYNDIIKQYTLNDKLSKEDLLISEVSDQLDFNKHLIEYVTLLSVVDGDLYNDLTDMFSWFQDLSVFDEVNYNKLQMTDEELVLYAREIIASIGDKQLLLFYDTLVNKHYVNILEYDKKYLEDPSQSMMGITMIDYLYNTSYVNIFRKHTVEDIDALVHETMHAYYNYILPRKDSDSAKFLLELEGSFGSMVTGRYLERDGLSDGLTLRKEELDFNLTNSYLLMANHIILSNPNSEYNLDYINARINEFLPNLNIVIGENDLKSYATVQGILKIIIMTSYFACLDLLNKHEPIECLDIIKSLKENDDERVLENLRNHGITFMDDGYKDLFSEYNYTHKKTLR